MNTLTSATQVSVLRKKIDLLLRTGQLLMESAADTSRTKRNMERAAAFLGLPKENTHIYINYDMLQVNVSDEGHSFSKMQRCDKHVINMLIIQDISKLTWEAIQKDYSLDQYANELEKIAHGKHYYSEWMIAVCAGLACGGFSIQFGADWTAFFYASLAAILGNRFRMFLNHIGSNVYANFAIGAFLSTIIAWLSSYLSMPVVQSVLPAGLAQLLSSTTPFSPLLACSLWVVPGVPLINAVNDLLDNNLENGLIRATNTMLMLTALAFGIVLAIKCGSIDNFAKDLSLVPHHNFLEYAIAAAISAMGFATIFNVPYRLMPWVAIGGIICVCARNFINLGPSTNNIGLGMGLIVGSLCGSALISIINIKAVHWFHTPHQCITIPAVIPIVPGVLMYRALYGFFEMQGVVGEVTVAMHNAINGTLVLICIALGVAIPNIFARKWIAPQRKAKLQRLINERKMRGKFVDLQEI